MKQSHEYRYVFLRRVPGHPESPLRARRDIFGHRTPPDLTNAGETKHGTLTPMPALPNAPHAAERANYYAHDSAGRVWIAAHLN